MFRRWMLESGVSRTARTSGRRSLRVTSAARPTRLCEKPVAIAASVFTVHGRDHHPAGQERAARDGRGEVVLGVAPRPRAALTSAKE